MQTTEKRNGQASKDNRGFFQLYLILEYSETLIKIIDISKVSNKTQLLDCASIKGIHLNLKTFQSELTPTKRRTRTLRQISRLFQLLHFRTQHNTNCFP